MQQLFDALQEIVNSSLQLKEKYLPNYKAKIDYVCIFSQNDKEYSFYTERAETIGRVVKQNEKGLLYKLQKPLTIKTYPVTLIRIRKPDPLRTERGYVDFVVDDFEAFKKNVVIKRKCFAEIPVDSGEMYELLDTDFSVRAFFPSMPLSADLKLGNQTY